LLTKYRYEFYLHGPFSLELAFSLDRLVSLEYLGGKEIKMPEGNILSVYELTKEGKEFLEQMRKGLFSPKPLKK
jgi:uncharacterized protein YwgA